MLGRRQISAGKACRSSSPAASLVVEPLRRARLTPWATDAATPAWSPDGSRIAFNTSDHFGAPQRIEVISANGTHPLTLFVSGQDIASFWPAWSPDGSSVAFTHVDTMSMPQSQLFVVPSGGGQAAPLMSEQEANQVGWSNVPSGGA